MTRKYARDSTFWIILAILLFILYPRFLEAKEEEGKERSTVFTGVAAFSCSIDSTKEGRVVCVFEMIRPHKRDSIERVPDVPKEEKKYDF